MNSDIISTNDLSSIDLLNLDIKKPLDFLETDSSFHLLGARSDTLARVFAVIDSLGMDYSDLAFCEMGSGNNIESSGWGLHSSNVSNYMLHQNLGLDYFGLDPLTNKEYMDFYPNALSRYFGDFKVHLSSKLDAGKTPLIFSNLVVGYIDANRDMDAYFSTNPIFWNLPGIHVHQYLVLDVVDRARQKGSLKFNGSLGAVCDIIINSDPETFNSSVQSVVKSAYDLDVPIYSSKIVSEGHSNALSVWKID